MRKSRDAESEERKINMNFDTRVNEGKNLTSVRKFFVTACSSSDDRFSPTDEARRANKLLREKKKTETRVSRLGKGTGDTRIKKQLFFVVSG